jgi:hypothetical protein
VAAAVAAFLLGSVAPLCAQDKDKFQETPYYPVKIGTTWTYKIGGQEQRIQIKVTKHEKVGNTTCAVLEASGAMPVTEYVSPQADGVYRFKGMNQEVTPPLLFFKLPAKKGEAWKVECKVGAMAVKGDCSEDEANVTVPAGKYDTIVVKNDLELNNTKVTTTYYFAKDVGMVKQVADINGVNIVLELEKFEAGK